MPSFEGISGVYSVRVWVSRLAGRATPDHQKDRLESRSGSGSVLVNWSAAAYWSGFGSRCDARDRSIGPGWRRNRNGRDRGIGRDRRVSPVGVIDGVQDGVNVKDGSGVNDGVLVKVGRGVLVGGGGGEGVQVTVGVAEGVQEMIGRTTGFLTSWQPLAKSMTTPKSLETTPVRGLPAAQSRSKSMAQV